MRRANTTETNTAGYRQPTHYFDMQCAATELENHVFNRSSPSIRIAHVRSAIHSYESRFMAHHLIHQMNQGKPSSGRIRCHSPSLLTRYSFSSPLMPLRCREPTTDQSKPAASPIASRAVSATSTVPARATPVTRL